MPPTVADPAPDLSLGFSTFFRSTSASDAKLVILLPRMQASKQTNLAASTSAGSTAAPRTKASSTVKHHSATTSPTLASIGAGGEDWRQVLCIPVHRVVFMAKCAYFSTLLRTAVGHSSATVITEYAESREDVQAILAAAECVYTDLMPVSNAMNADWDGGGCVETTTQVQRHIMALEVLQRWQSPSSIAACCRAICNQPAETIMWEDCHTFFSLPEGLKEQPDISSVLELVTRTTLNLCKPAPPILQQDLQQIFSTHVCKLPPSVRLALLKGCKLGFQGVLALLGSDEQFADSEDSVVVLLSLYLQGVEGQACTASEVKQLRDQLRLQHTSDMFLAFKLPGFPQLCLDNQELRYVTQSHNMNWAVFSSFDLSQGSHPPAWRMPARTVQGPQHDSCKLSHNVSQGDPPEHQKAAVIDKEGQSSGVAADPDLGLGFSRFFKSDWVSDAQFVILVRRWRALMETRSAASTSSGPVTAQHTTMVCEDTRRRKICKTSRLYLGSDGDWEELVCIPVHRVVLMAKCAFFNTFLQAAFANNPLSRAAVVIKEHADSADDVRAILAAAECVYADNLPLVFTGGDAMEGAGHATCGSQMQMRIMTLKVLHRWQAPSGIASCCNTICTGTSANTTWEDCYTCFNLLEGLHEQPSIMNVIKWAVDITVELSKSAVATPQQTVQQVLSARLLRLPAYARLALLKDGKLNYQGMLSLLSSDEKIADSEDDMALLLVSYMQGEAGKACSLFETNTLQDQLRFQHMSGAFFAFKLPSIPQLALNSRELSFLMYLAKIKGPVALPLDFSVPAFPQAWYKPARKLAHATKCGLENFFQITFNISESDLSDHLKAAALILAGGSTPSTLRSKGVLFRGISWIMSLQSMANGNVLLLAVQPNLGADVGIEAGKSGIYVDVTLRLDSAHPIITSTTQQMWTGLGGCGYSNFVQQFRKRPGDPTDLNWWKDYITDGHVRFSATVRLL